MHMNWDLHIKQFKNYLKLERSLSDNSIQAYMRDVVKLKEFVELSNQKTGPLQIMPKDLQKFLEFINKLGMSAFSQAAYYLVSRHFTGICYWKS
jgi:integrase/recombinase XerD